MGGMEICQNDRQTTRWQAAWQVGGMAGMHACRMADVSVARRGWQTRMLASWLASRFADVQASRRAGLQIGRRATRQIGNPIGSRAQAHGYGRGGWRVRAEKVVRCGLSAMWTVGRRSHAHVDALLLL